MSGVGGGGMSVHREIVYDLTCNVYERQLFNAPFTLQAVYPTQI